MHRKLLAFGAANFENPHVLVLKDHLVPTRVHLGRVGCVGHGWLSFR